MALNMPIHLLITGGLLILLSMAFLLAFLIPGVMHLIRLHKIQNQLSSFKSKIPLGDFKKLFAKDASLSHLWSEYQDTLHTQREEREGQMVVVAVRSTVPSEVFFNNQYVVDSRLRTEFFKHLPGIFTGLGIIGTFSGLIEGLHHFQVSENASTARQSLESLMHSVGEAFLISAAAIGAAMLFTFLEKLLISSIYHKTEKIAHRIDANFDGGIGEEYLYKLVNSSEASASQSKILKDALVKELGDILRQLTESQLSSNRQLNQQLAHHIEDATRKQVEASREDNQALGDVIAGSIQRSLKAPLDEIASAVKTASSDQSGSAIQMLNDVMISFSQRINDLFGGQINGINELNRQSAQSMQDAVASLNRLVGKLEENGRQATDDMAQQMAAAIKNMEERQAKINIQTQDVIEQIRKSMQTSQSETQNKLQETLSSVAQQMSSIMAALGESQNRVFQANSVREQAMADRSAGLVGQISGSVEAAVKEMAMASKTMAQSVSTLSSATSNSVDKMNLGAERLTVAAENFAAAGDRVTSVMNQASVVSGRLTELSGQLSSSTGALQESLRDYKDQRQAVVTLLSDVRTTIELARKEASLTSDFLQRIEVSTQKLVEAQRSADNYLEGVTDVLAESNLAFRNSVTTTLSKVNTEFHTKLSEAVGLLSSAVQELEVTLGSLNPRR